MNLNDVFISHYPTKESHSPTKKSVQSALEEIRSGQYREIIEQCRITLQQKGKTEYDLIKGSLPAVTFSALYATSRSRELQAYTSLVAIDIDHLDASDLARHKHALTLDPHVISVWLSPSGQGLKVLIPVGVSSEFHKSAFCALRNYLWETYHIPLDNLDKRCSDVSRLCFVSYDPEMNINRDAEPFNIDIDSIFNETTQATSRGLPRVSSSQPELGKDRNRSEAFLLDSSDGRNSSSDRMAIKRVIKFLELKHLSITFDYLDWLNVGLAVANTFTYELGEPLFLRLSRMDRSKFDEDECKNMLRYLYLNRRFGKVRLGTLIRLAKEKGYEPSRHSPTRKNPLKGELY